MRLPVIVYSLIHFNINSMKAKYLMRHWNCILSYLSLWHLYQYLIWAFNWLRTAFHLLSSFINILNHLGIFCEHDLLFTRKKVVVLLFFITRFSKWICKQYFLEYAKQDVVLIAKHTSYSQEYSWLKSSLDWMVSLLHTDEALSSNSF